MKVHFNTFFRGVILVLLISLAWSLWAGAQTITNQSKASETNAGSAPGKGLEHPDGRYVTFGLERVEPLRRFAILGEPLWKYIASLIYILLAFYVSKLIDLVTCVWLKKLAARTETKLDDFLLELLHGPIKVVVFVLFL